MKDIIWDVDGWFPYDFGFKTKIFGFHAYLIWRIGLEIKINHGD